MFEFLIAFLDSYLVHVLGVAIGYHRLLSHRSYKCPKFVEYFWVGLGYFAFQSSPIWWATMHRAHHRYSDTELDPHANLHGWRRSIYGWIFDEKYPDHVDPQVCGKDLINDPVYRFLDQGGRVQRAHLLNGFLNFLLRIGIYCLFGLPIALGSLAAGLMMQQVTLIFNKVSHIPEFGYQNFDSGDDSINNRWLSVITLGEGLHNNHHACPGSANNALGKREFDFSFMVIRLMQTLGLVRWANDGARQRVKLETVPAISVVEEFYTADSVSEGEKRVPLKR